MKVNLVSLRNIRTKKFAETERQKARASNTNNEQYRMQKKKTTKKTIARPRW